MAELNVKEVREILSRYVDLSEFPDYRLGEFDDGINVAGCFMVGDSWYVYVTDEKHNQYFRGPIKSKAIIEACMLDLHFNGDEKDREKRERRGKYREVEEYLLKGQEQENYRNHVLRTIDAVIKYEEQHQ
jgi:hypothetical protein